jgi:hypothetical protein
MASVSGIKVKVVDQELSERQKRRMATRLAETLAASIGGDERGAAWSVLVEATRPNRSAAAEPSRRAPAPPARDFPT